MPTPRLHLLWGAPESADTASALTVGGARERERGANAQFQATESAKTWETALTRDFALNRICVQTHVALNKFSFRP